MEGSVVLSAGVFPLVPASPWCKGKAAVVRLVFSYTVLLQGLVIELKKYMDLEVLHICPHIFLLCFCSCTLDLSYCCYDSVSGNYYYCMNHESLMCSAHPLFLT